MTVRMDAELLRFLSDPKSYGLDSGGSDVTAIQHIETHISHVFLTSKHAFKIKKPLQLDFLDYTTLAKRKYFCQRELELNKRYAEELYVDVVAIMRDGHKFNFNGKGDALSLIHI